MTMALWRAEQPLVLASKSAVRRLVLESSGIPLEIVPADIDERGLETQAGARTPGEVAILLAHEKARAVSARLAERLVLGADQTLALGEQRFSKPADRAAARAQLMALRGRTHELHSAISLQRDGVVVFEHCAVARLTMRAFSVDFLAAYMDAVGDAMLASVGCYQVEGQGIHLFDRIEGDHFTVMGLPLVPLLEFLRREGSLAA
jgi:septum formation protein